MLRRMLSPPDLTRANRSKKARSSRRRGSATNMNYTMYINFILLAIAPGGSVTCRALFVVSCGRDGWPLAGRTRSRRIGSSGKGENHLIPPMERG